MPFHKQVPCIVRKIGFTGNEHRNTFSLIQLVIAIACNHIHERTREVPFVVVVGFKSRSGIPGKGISAFLS